MSAREDLDTELELISSSLLPAETLSSSSSWPREVTIANSESQKSLHITLGRAYPQRSAVSVELKSPNIGRDAAEEWRRKIDEILGTWEESEDYPLYAVATAYLLPLLVPETAAPALSISSAQVPPSSSVVLHHALLTSHHLLSPTKRKNFLALSSQLSLTGFSKVGHPGIYYAVGDRRDLEEWVREVKSWNWLALRVRVGVEPVPEGGGDDAETLAGRGSESGARGGKGRGDWVELEKIKEALNWLKKRGREKMLLEIGIGGGE